MADVVQYRLERMVPELDDLEKRSLFTRSEITEIVKTRRKFEYRLKRPSPIKQDFLDYIEYEKQLDRLRLLRKKSVSRQIKEKGNKRMKTSLSDFAGVRRVIELYRMATSRFKGDLELWFQYLEFCKLRNNGRMKKALGEVVRFHPKVPAVWIYAAAWEFENNLNPKAADVMMLQGIRACPTSEDIWVEFIRLKLTFLNKLAMRQRMLGKDNGTLVRDDTDNKQNQWEDENETLFMSLDEEKEAEDGLNIFRENGFTVVHDTYKAAVKALPSSMSLRRKILEIVEATDLARSEELSNEILADMRRDFFEEPEYWDWLARRKLTDPFGTLDISSESGRSHVEEISKVYEEAINVAPSVAMFEMYIKFLINLISPGAEEMPSSWNSSVSEQAGHFFTQLVRVFQKAEALECLNEDLVCQYIKLYLHMGQIDEALKLAENFCNGKFSNARQLWVLRVTEQMRCIKSSGNCSKVHLSSVYGLLKNMIKKVATADAEELWVMALDLFASRKKFFEKLLELSFVLLAKDGGTDEGFSLPAALVLFVLRKDGIQRARDLYRRLVTLPRPGLALYKCCIELELSAGDDTSLPNARKLFDSALATHSQDISLWREYYSMETKIGSSETANAVYWRAKKILGDASVLSVSDSSVAGTYI